MKKDDDKVKRTAKSSVNFADLGRVCTDIKNEKVARCDDNMLEKLMEIVNGYRGDDYHVMGEIPQKKLSASTNFHGVDSKDTVLVLLDSTLMGSAENGISITLKGIYWKNTWLLKTLKNSYTWEELSKLVNEIEIQDSTIVFENEVKLYAPATYPKLSILNLIKELTNFFVESTQGNKDTEQSAPSKDEVINQNIVALPNIANSKEPKIARRDDNMIDELMKIVNSYLYGVFSSYYVMGKIPERKLSASTDFHGVNSKDTVLALLDSTLMGSAENGMSITLKGIYWNNMFGKTRRNYYSWDELINLVNKIEIQDGRLVFEQGV